MKIGKLHILWNPQPSVRRSPWNTLGRDIRHVLDTPTVSARLHEPLMKNGQRMTSDEIEALVAQWNEGRPPGPGRFAAY